MDVVLWFFLPIMVAIGSAALTYCVMQARLDAAVADQREKAARSHADAEFRTKLTEEKIKAAEEAAYHRAFDQFLNEFRVEERQFLRDDRDTGQKSVVLQERLFFRNIPLSRWIECEIAVDSFHPERIPSNVSVFNPRALIDRRETLRPAASAATAS
jgi:hypothetical protein